MYPQSPQQDVALAGFNPLALVGTGLSALGGLGGLLGKLPSWAQALLGVAGAAGAGTAVASLTDIDVDFGTAGPGLFDVGVPGPGITTSGIPGTYQSEVPVKKWYTGTATFYLMNTGRIAVQKKNGVWKVYRPARHIVLSRNPRVGNLMKAERRFVSLTKGLGRTIRYEQKLSKKKRRN